VSRNAVRSKAAVEQNAVPKRSTSRPRDPPNPPRPRSVSTPRRGRSTEPKPLAPLAPIVNFADMMDEKPPQGGPIGGPMSEGSVPPFPRNKKPRTTRNKKVKEDDVLKQIADMSKLGPGQQALAPPVPLVRPRGKGKAKAKRNNGGLATIMEYNDIGDDPYVMRPKVQ